MSAAPPAGPPPAAAGDPSASNGRAAPEKASAAYFTSLTLRNVRCFGDDPVTLDLSDGETADGLKKPAQWTVLMGENGTGKTTVLEALQVLHYTLRGHRFGGTAAPILLLPTDTKDPEVAAQVDALLLYISLGRAGSVEGFHVEASVSSGDMATPHSQWFQNATTDPKNLLDPLATPAAGPKPFPTLLYRVDRAESGRGKEPGRGTATNPLEPAEWLAALEHAALKSGSNSQASVQFKKAQRMLAHLLPGVEEVRVSNPDVLSLAAPVEFFVPPDDWVPLHRVAFGYQSLFAWVIDHLARLIEHYPDSRDPLTEPAVVLVDEIELHLHPKMQREVMGKLSDWFPNTQFIVTTHSPLIAQAAAERRANFAVLAREKDAAGNPAGPVRIDNTPEAVAGWRLEQILASDLFDTSPAPPRTEKLLEQRVALLSKPDATEGELAEADRLGREADRLTEDPERARTQRILKEAAEALARHAARTAELDPAHAETGTAA